MGFDGSNDFFPELLSGPFMVGIKIAFSISFLLYMLAALASWLGGSTARAEALDEQRMALAESRVG